MPRKISIIKLSLFTKILILCLSLVFSTALVLGVIQYTQFRSLSTRVREEAMNRLLETKAAEIQSSLEELDHDVRWIAQFVQAQLRRGETLETLTPIVEKLMQFKPDYDQIRVLGYPPEGSELIRFNRTVVNGEDQVVKSDILQKKGHRDYYAEILSTPSQKTYFSAINLNREFHEIELPHKPTLRAAVRLPDARAGDLAHIVIINIRFQNILDSLKLEQLKGLDFYLIQQDGTFILHPDTAKIFANDLGTNFYFKNLFPITAGFLESRETSKTYHLESVPLSGNSILHLYHFHPFPGFPERMLILGVASNEGAFLAQTKQIGYYSISAFIVLLIVATGLAVWASGQITRPIHNVTHAIHRITENRDATVILPTFDLTEVGRLSSSFSKLRQEIEDKEQSLYTTNEKLRIANRDLNHFTHAFSHELSEPTRRISALISLSNLEEGYSQEIQSDIQEQCGHLIGMLSEYRELSKLEFEEQLRESVDIKDCIENSIRDWQKKDPDRSDQIQFRVGNHPEVKIYPRLGCLFFQKLLDGVTNNLIGEGCLCFESEVTSEHPVFHLRWQGPHQFPKISGTRIPFEHPKYSVFSICNKIIARHSGVLMIEASGSNLLITYRF